MRGGTGWRVAAPTCTTSAKPCTRMQASPADGAKVAPPVACGGAAAEPGGSSAGGSKAAPSAQMLYRVDCDHKRAAPAPAAASFSRRCSAASCRQAAHGAGVAGRGQVFQHVGSMLNTAAAALSFATLPPPAPPLPSHAAPGRHPRPAAGSRPWRRLHRCAHPAADALSRGRRWERPQRGVEGRQAAAAAATPPRAALGPACLLPAGRLARLARLIAQSSCPRPSQLRDTALPRQLPAAAGAAT